MNKHLKKVLIGLAIGFLTLLYVISPVDIIPDAIPCAGQMDDIGAVLGNVAYWAYVAFTVIKALRNDKKQDNAGDTAGDNVQAKKSDMKSLP